MCVFIDANIDKIAVAGEYPEIENQVYNYLWLLVKALAIKKCMFKNFSDYDGYATHAANRLFFALRNNYLNQGKTIKGKQIRPIKSCLNYTKALLYPMKVEYQNEAFREIITEEFVSPPVGLDAEVGKFAPCGYGVEREIQSPGRSGREKSKQSQNQACDEAPALVEGR